VCAVSLGHALGTAQRATGPTRLVVPVAEVEARVPGAHITLVDPFLPAEDVDEGVLAELRELFGALVPFAYVLGEPASFPSGEMYLPPQPVTVFRRITHNLRRAFPECVGPATSLDTVIPHLSVPDATVVPTPLEVHAREARLLSGEGESEQTLATFVFGTTAA
jgi:hypothetical protein